MSNGGLGSHPHFVEGHRGHRRSLCVPRQEAIELGGLLLLVVIPFGQQIAKALKLLCCPLNSALLFSIIKCKSGQAENDIKMLHLCVTFSFYACIWIEYTS